VVHRRDARVEDRRRPARRAKKSRGDNGANRADTASKADTRGAPQGAPFHWLKVRPSAAAHGNSKSRDKGALARNCAAGIGAGCARRRRRRRYHLGQHRGMACRPRA